MQTNYARFGHFGLWPEAQSISTAGRQIFRLFYRGARLIPQQRYIRTHTDLAKEDNGFKLSTEVPSYFVDTPTRPTFC